MPNPTRAWQMISLALALALIASLAELYRSSTAYRPAVGTVLSVNSAASFEHLAQSPNARRVNERYSL